MSNTLDEIKYLFNDVYLAKVLEIFQPRINTMADFIPATYYFFTEEFEYKDILDKENAPKVIDVLFDLVGKLQEFNEKKINEELKNLCASLNLKAKIVFPIINIILTGNRSCPPCAKIMEILGKERVLTRIIRARKELAFENCGPIRILPIKE